MRPMSLNRRRAAGPPRSRWTEGSQGGSIGRFARCGVGLGLPRSSQKSRVRRAFGVLGSFVFMHFVFECDFPELLRRPRGVVGQSGGINRSGGSPGARPEVPNSDQRGSAHQWPEQADPHLAPPNAQWHPYPRRRRHCRHTLLRYPCMRKSRSFDDKQSGEMWSQFRNQWFSIPTHPDWFRLLVLA